MTENSPSRDAERQHQQAAEREQRRVQPELRPGGVVQQRQQPHPAALALLPPEPPADAQVARPEREAEQPHPEPQRGGAVPAAVPG